MPRLLSPIFALCLILGLAACDTAEERADEHYLNALTLLEEGDVGRAIVELRNVFRFVPNHKEARYELARAFLNERKNERQAYSQFLRIAEQYPDDLEARIELSMLAFFSANWEEMERHGAKALEIDPENPQVKTIQAALNYRSAVAGNDDAARFQAVAYANDLLEQHGFNRVLKEVVFDDHLRSTEYTDALTTLDEIVAVFPDTKRYQMQRLQVLLSIGDQVAVEAQLVSIIDQYPDDSDTKQMLVRYYLSRGELDKTEDFLRKLVVDAPEGENSPRIDLIRFLMELRSVDDATAELVAAIDSEPNPAPFIIFKAALDFSTGNQSLAIADLQTAIETVEDSPETNELKVSLAQMLSITGNEVGARSLIGEVLEADNAQTGALKLNAGWLIEADDTDSAIAGLRTVLDVNPEDAEAMTLMAQAYLRSGITGLARDYLSLAVEASGNAPKETNRYVQFLISEERYLPAEDILLPALRIAPNDVELLRTAAQLYLAMDDLGRLQQVIETLRRNGSESAMMLANAFEASRLNQQGNSDSAIAYLEQLAENAPPGDVSRIMLVRARIAQNDFENAIALAEEIIVDQPDNPALKLMLARTLTVAGEIDRAIVQFQSLIEAFPEEGQFSVELAALQVRNGQPDLARESINTGLERNPDDSYLLWAHASNLEKDGDIDGAINVYEALYEEQSDSIVIANNLASLLATYRDDEESLTRAWIIARRFSNSEVPAVQDTYGWIAFRRGDAELALPYLESAAGQLNDPIVSYHYAEVLLALDRKEDALAQYRVSLDLIGVGDTRPQILRAQQKTAELEAELASSTQ